MPRKTNLLKSIAKNYKGKATNSATCGLYKMMWGQEPPKGKKKVKTYQDFGYEGIRQEIGIFNL